MILRRDISQRPPLFRWGTLLVVILGLGFLQSAPHAAQPPSSKPAPKTASADDNMPITIRRHSKAFQESWRRIEAVIRENERLKKPRPEPYLDRAELMASVRDHESAMKDCLAAVRIVRSSTNNLAEQARYLGLLEKALQRIVDAPEPLYIANADEQFRRGRSLFHRGLDKQALVRLNSAVKLRPNEPLFLYFRGLTLKRLGREAEATSDVRRAVSLDVKQTFGDSLNVSTLRLRTQRAKSFERVQGPLRAWMDSHFDGVPVAPITDLTPPGTR